MKALVIEDTLTSATLICHQLRKIGIEPMLARNGSGGLDLFKEHRPDLVLLDVVLPDMEGFDVAKRIRQLERDGEWTPIIFLTARTSDEDLERGITVGGDDYLIKPVSEIVLTAKVRAMQRIAQMRYSLVVLTRRLDAANLELVRLSTADGLTGIANRRHFDDSLQREWGRAIRQETPLSLVMIDIDWFKAYNDHYGHQAGDECLQGVARILHSRLRRSTDLVARYGGEEFATVLPDTYLDGAFSVAESMQAGLAQWAAPHEKSERFRVVTASMGVAACWPQRGMDARDLIKIADEALYAAKHAGRNRIEAKIVPDGGLRE